MNNNGFTLIEVMIAIMVLTIGLLGAGAMQLSSTKGNANACDMTEATNLALNQIESISSWDFNDARLTDNDQSDTNAAPPAVNFQRVGILGPIGPGNNLMRPINDVADNSTTFEDYTVYWDVTPRMDIVTGVQLGLDTQIYVVWNDGGRLKTVAMNFIKSR